jgi:hypothetical protein
MLASIHWVRVVIAAVLSEVGVVAALLIGIALYKKMSAHAAEASSQSLGERIGYYVAPPAGFVTTGLAAFWAVHVLETAVIATALTVGALSVAITIPFFLGAKPEHRLMYGIAFALRLLAAYLAAVLVLHTAAAG